MAEKQKQKESMYQRGFRNFALQHYLRAINSALYITNQAGAENHLDSALYEVTYRVILERLTSPIVFLRQEWDKMPFNEKARYDPELAKAAKELEK